MRYLLRVYARPCRGWFYLFYYPTCGLWLVSGRNDYEKFYYARLGWLEFGFSSLPY